MAGSAENTASPSTISYRSAIYPECLMSQLMKCLVQATIITADGTIRTVNETVHPDLFWAIRGGGSNFGVVTEFVLRLHPQRRTVFAGPAVFPGDALQNIHDVTLAWRKQGPSPKEGMIQVLTRGGPGRQVGTLRQTLLSISCTELNQIDP